MISPSASKAIAAHVVHRAEMMRKDPADLIWLGDMISNFIHSPEYNEAVEHDVAVLIKAAQDAAAELDDLKNMESICTEYRDRLQSIVERVYSACETLGIEVGKVEVQS